MEGDSHEHHAPTVEAIEGFELGEFRLGRNEEYGSSANFTQFLKFSNIPRIFLLPLALLEYLLRLVDPLIDIFLELPLGPALLHDISAGEVHHNAIGHNFADIVDEDSIGTDDLAVVLLILLLLFEELLADVLHFLTRDVQIFLP